MASAPIYMFTGFPIIFGIMFFTILGLIIFTAIKGISQWNKNNKSPVLTVDATIIAKRTNVSHHHHNTGNGAMNTMSSTTYYVTFQVQSGDRMEFHVASNEYGMLAEGDIGKLTFQGTRYLRFDRNY